MVFFYKKKEFKNLHTHKMSLGLDEQAKNARKLCMEVLFYSVAGADDGLHICTN
jgi:hypothetical protein